MPYGRCCKLYTESIVATRFYYHVWVRSAQYRGDEALTYHHTDALLPGTIVLVPLREEHVPGVVVKTVARPLFTTKAIAIVADLPPLPATSLLLAAWLKQFYPAPIGIIMQQFLPRSLPPGRPITGGETTSPQHTTQPPLTDGQRVALARIASPDTYVLHGRTGSGKTRIYTELAARALANGKSALILSPEIGLTSQLAAAFRDIFGGRVIILHSQLKPSERLHVWRTILAGRQPLVVIGPRSALFSPLADIGVIVVDEAHDQAYKQEQAPYYQAVRVASQLSQIHKAILVLGSATPAVSDYYLALEKRKPIIRLENLAKGQPLARRVSVVDLKDRSHFSRAAHISNELLEAIGGSLARHEQSLLYLNRRGTARIALCERCGWQARCPHCDLPLSYHGDEHALRCHVCGHRQAAAPSCPACGSPSIVLRSFGTKAIVAEIQRQFPEAHVARFDTDSHKAERLENQYTRLVQGETDILVGTQLLAKGLDLPRLSTLGVILADSSLYLPDYTAAERTYQLITQVLGRIGRGHVAGHAIVQTYTPASPLLQAALHDDWDSFYNAQMQERRAYHLPPFFHLLKLSCRRATATAAEHTAHQLKTALLLQHQGITVDGPSPSLHEKVGNAYQWQLVVRSRRRSILLAVIKSLSGSGWTYDIDPADLL